MELDQLLSVIEVENLPECWRDCWDDWHRAYPGAGFMDPGLVDLAAASTELDPGFVDALRQTVRIIRASNELLLFAWLWHCYFLKREDRPSSWPVPEAFGEDFAGMFPAAVLITGLPSILEMHRRLGIPEQVTRDTLSDIRLWSQHYRQMHGRWGFGEQQWLQHHFRCRLFRLKRLEFMPATYSGGYGYRVYRHKADRSVIAIPECGIRFRRDGLVDGTTGVTDPQAWDSVLVEEQEHVRGGAVCSDGHATRKRVEIRLSDWEVLLEKGTKLLDVHIPADGPMDPRSCLESYQMANEFFPRFFPEHRYTGFVCCSWLLDPELEKILPAESNIVQFQREFYLLPTLSDDQQTFERVFGGRPDDLTEAPRDTSLRRAILDHYLAGNRMSKGYGFIPADEIGRTHGYFGR
jgi:hypothetical protein